MCSRYYFNLTDGDRIIRDQDGLELADIDTAIIYANKAIEELRAEASVFSDEWQGWRMEIHNCFGDVVSVIPLVDFSLRKKFLQ
ncbi:DUF6894 family protein [Microvirga sp. P5_D2]